jgi:cell division protein ZapE
MTLISSLSSSMQLTQLSGTKDPRRQIAKQLKKRHDILCFDEFFVTDIGDAMLLGRLIIYLFEQNMIVVATSNCVPDELYKDGLQRANFYRRSTPFIRI